MHAAVVVAVAAVVVSVRQRRRSASSAACNVARQRLSSVSPHTPFPSSLLFSLAITATSVALCLPVLVLVVSQGSPLFALLSLFQSPSPSFLCFFSIFIIFTVIIIFLMRIIFDFSLVSQEDDHGDAMNDCLVSPSLSLSSHTTTTDSLVLSPAMPCTQVFSIRCSALSTHTHTHKLTLQTRAKY